MTAPVGYSHLFIVGCVPCTDLSAAIIGLPDSFSYLSP